VVTVVAVREDEKRRRSRKRSRGSRRIILQQHYQF
jgi:hypothetical protein